MASAVSTSPFRDSLPPSALRSYCEVTTTGLMVSYLSLTTRNTCVSVQSVGGSLPRSSITRRPHRDSPASTSSSLSRVPNVPLRRAMMPGMSVTRTLMPSSTAMRATAEARCVLPVPTGPKT